MLSLFNFGVHIYFAQDCVWRTHLDAWDTVRLVAETLAATYLALISACYACTKTVTHHASLTQHICALGAVSFVQRYLVSLGQYLDVHSMAIIHWTEYLALGIAFALTIVSSRIPLGPLLHQDLSNLYSRAVDAKLAESGYDGSVRQPNVNQEVSASIWSFLLFTYVLPMISRTSAMEQVDITDLPAPQAWLRSQNVILDSYDLSTGSGVSGRLGPTVGLLWAVWSPEWRVLLKGWYSCGFGLSLGDIAEASFHVHAGALPAVVPPSLLLQQCLVCPGQRPEQPSRHIVGGPDGHLPHHEHDTCHPAGQLVSVTESSSVETAGVRCTWYLD